MNRFAKIKRLAWQRYRERLATHSPQRSILRDYAATHLEMKLKTLQSRLRTNFGIVRSYCAGTALVRPTSETILASIKNSDHPGH